MNIGHNSRLVAIVDDDESVQRALQDLIESDGLSALCFSSAEQFLDSEARSKAACLIADIRMPGISGLNCKRSLRPTDLEYQSSSSLRMGTQRCGLLPCAKVQSSS
jgi:FixJ family two-component response regulator